MQEENFEIYRALREDIGMKTYLHGPMNYAKKLKLRFGVGDLDLSERRNIYTSSREATNMRPCGTTIESRTHIVGECEICKEERDALKEAHIVGECEICKEERDALKEEMRKLDV